MTLGLAVASLVTYGVFLRQWLLREVTRLSEPALLSVLPRRRMITTLLSQSYGGTPESVRHVAHAILGGAGDHPEDGEPVVSNKTSVKYKLQDQRPGIYELISTEEYSFPRPIHDDRVVIFATCDSVLKEVIGAGATCQIFEYWYTSDKALFRSSVDQSFESMGIGISYQDVQGGSHDVDVFEIVARVVPIDEWEQYLSFFGEVSSGQNLDPRNFGDTLRIYEYSLSDLEIAGHLLASVTKITMQTRTLQSVDDPYCFWSASFPCYMDKIIFDLSQFGKREQSSIYEFMLVAFLIRGIDLPASWVSVDILEVPIGSWLLPGHGIALLWRRTSTSNT